VVPEALVFFPHLILPLHPFLEVISAYLEWIITNTLSKQLRFLFPAFLLCLKYLLLVPRPPLSLFAPSPAPRLMKDLSSRALLGRQSGIVTECISHACCQISSTAWRLTHLNGVGKSKASPSGMYFLRGLPISPRSPVARFSDAPTVNLYYNTTSPQFSLTLVSPEYQSILKSIQQF
jgi:hypothetical protein